MRRLTLSEWSKFADIVAAATVVISLVFVGLQVRDNTNALRSQTERALVDAIEKLQIHRVTDAEYAELLLRAESGAELSPLDVSRIRTLSYLYLDNWEQAFHDHEKGFIDADVWQALDRWLRHRLAIGHFDEFVAEAARSGDYSEDFSAHLRAALDRSSASND